MTDIIRNLELSVRATNVLTAYGRVKTLEDFMALDRATVMAQPKSGARTWEEIKHLQLYLLREEKREWPEPVDVTIDGVHDEMRLTFTSERSLRDAAALAALQGFCAQADSSGSWSWLPDMAAAEAWRVADAFIAAREGKTE